jgi:hypothetical protein
MLNLSIPQILFFGGEFLACLALIWLHLRGLNLTVAICSDSQNRECASLNTNTLKDSLINLTREEAQISKLRMQSKARSKAKGSQKYAAGEAKRAPPGDEPAAGARAEALKELSLGRLEGERGRTSQVI